MPPKSLRLLAWKLCVHVTDSEQSEKERFFQAGVCRDELAGVHAREALLASDFTRSGGRMNVRPMMHPATCRATPRRTTKRDGRQPLDERDIRVGQRPTPAWS